MRKGAGPVVGKAETVNWTGLLINSTYAPKPGAQHCEEWRTFSAFSLSFLSSERRRTARRFYSTPNEMNVKRGSKPTAEPTKTKEKLKNPQQAKTRAVESQEGLKHTQPLPKFSPPSL